MKKFALFASGMVALLAVSAASAATCTTNAGAGNWNTVATWSCGHVPIAADSVVITRNITAVTTTITDLTINAGVVLSGRGRTITITGNLTNNGTADRGARFNVTGAASVISGTGTYNNSRFYISGAAPSIAAGAVLNFTGNSPVYIGRTANGTSALNSVLTINGTINSTVTPATTQFLRFYANNTVIGATGAINAGVSVAIYNNGTAKVTNNGTVILNQITQSAATNAWTQGANANLTLSAVSTVGAMNAAAVGNTVTFNTPATPIPGTYFNLAGTGVTCPLAAGITVMGTSPCTLPLGVVGVTLNPTACVNDPGIGTVAWTFAANPLPARATRVVRNVTTNYVKCTGYGFAIPVGVTITGIAVGVNRLSSGGTISDAAVRTVKAGAIGATDRSTLTNYTRAAVLQQHGGAADLWGNTWLPADINATNFGAAFAAKNTNTVSNRNRTVTVSGMPITVYYTTGTTVDHLLIQHPPTALTCQPQTVLVSACANATCTAFVAGVSVTLSPGGAVVTTVAAGSVPGTVAQATAGPATLAATTLTPILGPTQCQVTGGVASSAACANAMNFALSGFVFAPNPLNLVSGTTVPLTISAVQANPVNTANRCVPAFANVVRPVNLSIAYVYPVAVTLPASVTAAGVTGAVGTAASPFNLAFDATGMATIQFSYPDVGQLNLTATATAPTGAALAGTGAIISAPASFAFSNITPGLIKAGTNFSATISAMNAAVPPAVTPNFGKETAPAIVMLTNNLVAPVGGVNPALGGTTSIPAGGIAFVNGVATVNNLTWGEVGNITLTAATTNYLGSGLSTNNVLSTSATVGQFIPEHFDTAILPVTNGAPLQCPTGITCPANALGVTGMVYSGQPFTVQATAKNLAGATTQNYAGVFARNVTLSAWNALGGLVANPPAGGGALANGQIAAGVFAAGVGSTPLPTYTLPVYAPLQGGIPTVVPTNFFIRAVDADLVSSLRAAGTVEAGLMVAYGRVKVSNAYGSELLPLTLNAAAQYYSATGWTASLTDNVTTLAIAASASYPIVAGGVTVGNTPTTMIPASGIMSSGQLSIRLGAPGAGIKGVATVTPAVMPVGSTYLPVLPGTATFGVYGGSNVFIYQRESY